MEKNVLIVLDLNGTLLHSSPQKLEGISDVICCGSKYVYLRPNLSIFLDGLCELPHVQFGVWSSHVRRNTECIVEEALPQKFKDRLLFVYAREECEKGTNFSTIKRPGRITECFSCFSKNRIVFVDDSPEKMDPDATFFQIPTFDGTSETDNHLLNTLFQLKTLVDQKLSSSCKQIPKQ